MHHDATGAAVQDREQELAGRPLGEILIGTVGLAPERVDAALAVQRAGEGLRLGELLVRAGAVAKEDVLRAVALQAEFRTRSASIRHDAQGCGPESVSGKRENGVRTRLVSLLALAAVATFFGQGISSVYRAFTDSFVAPFVLSPGNPAVIQNRLGLSRLRSEREQLSARLQEDAAAIEAADRAIGVLKQLRATATRSRPGTASAGGTLHMARGGEGREELMAVLGRQQKYVAGLEKDLAAGLVHEGDLVREQNALNHVHVALLQDDRENLATRIQLAQIELDLLKNEAERRSRLAQRHASEEELGRLDELLKELQRQPLSRAVERSQNLAFVPYSQMEGVLPGAGVYQCRVWGLLGCARVGAVSEIVPGEVVAQDPWGGTSRGEYAVLELIDGAAARSKSLRVRGPAGGSAAGSPASMMSSR